MDWNMGYSGGTMPDPRKTNVQTGESNYSPQTGDSTGANGAPPQNTTGQGMPPPPGAPPPNAPPPGAPPGPPGGPVRIPYGRSMPSFPSAGTGYPSYGPGRGGYGGYPSYGPRAPRAGYQGATNYPQPGNTYPVAGGQGERPGAWTPPWQRGGAGGFMPPWGGGGGYMLNQVNPQQGYTALQQRQY